VRRARLVDALEDGVPRHKLTLVAAPAGYGKTTLLADWARASRFPIAWLSISEEANDLERFFRYLLTAWEGAQPEISDSSLAVLLGAMTPERDAILTAFINVAGDLAEEVVFVLADYHLIDDMSIHDALTFLIDNVPPTVHFVLSVRGEPPLPLARYRARQQMIELHAADLMFRVEETEAFLNGRMDLDLADEAITSVQAQLEGRIAGTQMAALSLRRHRQPVSDLVVTGRHRFIADYLSQDVVATLPEDLRRFMLRTSILDRLYGPLCDAVTGGADGQALLETIERENLFLVPLDENREWYRYHRLLSDFLQGELWRQHPEDVADLHRRASDWCFDHDLPEPAFQHAVAANAPELVVRIFERYMNVKLNSGELRDVARWLDTVPADWFATHPVLNLSRAGLLAFSGDFAACQQCVEDVEARLKRTGRQDAGWQLAMVTAVRCFIACRTISSKLNAMPTRRCAICGARVDPSPRRSTTRSATPIGDTDGGMTRRRVISPCRVSSTLPASRFRRPSNPSMCMARWPTWSFSRDTSGRQTATGGRRWRPSRSPRARAAWSCGSSAGCSSGWVNCTTSGTI
jgi:LuxR family maltose regulon positive regulatory protein